MRGIIKTVTPKEILQKIIDTKGDCGFASENNHCVICPLSKLRQYDDGSYMSCLDALNVWDAQVTDVNDTYVKAAQNALVDLELEEMLKED